MKTNQPRMLKTIYRHFLVFFVFGSLFNKEVSANTTPSNINLVSSSSGLYTDNMSFVKTGVLTIKKDTTYDESKDPALRKGTENWEEPQGSFFVIPALVIGMIAVVLFFNKE